MSYRTIKIKKYSDVIEEEVAHAAITPGMLVEYRTDGKVQAHSGVQENAIPMFALEDELQGKTISDAYAENAPVQVWVAGRGDIVYGILKQGQNVTAGTWLVSNGDGKLKAAASPASAGDVDPEELVGIAVAAVNATSADTRILVRIK